jgi:hypothetical protein
MKVKRVHTGTVFFGKQEETENVIFGSWEGGGYMVF